MKYAFAALLASAALLATPAAAQSSHEARSRNAFGASLTTGVDYSIGDYGASGDTKILVVPISLRVKRGNIRLGATLPYLRIDGPGNIVGSGNGGPIVIDPKDPAPRVVRKGLGDVSLSASYSIPDQLLHGFEVDIGGRVKLPTSSAKKRLGTGKADLAVTLDVARPIGNFAPFVSVGYRMPGNVEGIELRNSAITSVGATVTAGSTTFIASYDYSAAASEFAKDSHSLFGGLNVPVNNRFSFTGYGAAGLNNGAPDFGGGLLLSARIF